MEVIVAVAPTLSEEHFRTFYNVKGIILVKNASYEVMGNSDFALVTSGTATLETGFFGTPMVVVYKTSWPTYLIGRLLVRVTNIGLVNIVAGKQIVPEFIQHQAKAATLAREVLKVLRDETLLATMKKELLTVRGKLGEIGACIACRATNPRTGLSVNIVRPLLLPLSFVYGAGVALRNWFFEMGLLSTRSVDVPVISVGNLSVGGVGKTPLVELLAKRLTQKGKKVAVISRGYKRKTSGTVVVSNGVTKCAEATDAGDEPAQMASKLTGVVVVVDEQRVRGALYAIRKFGVNVIILDDGFQHRYLRRDVDIVVLPKAEVADPGWMLPGGNRREPMSSLARATLIAISRCDSTEQYLQTRASLRRWTDKKTIGLATKVSSFRRANTGFSVDLAGLKGKSAVAFSGIGSPDAFHETLRSLGLNLKSHAVFSDHHPYSERELMGLEEAVRESGADFLVTTEKDVARINTGETNRKSFLERAPLFYIEIEQTVPQEESTLNEIMDRL